ncbi:MAG: hypothetical protein GEV09_03690 [Pseudonocardiaceae bacterium]|nr:hypothetical protein [Pseudonocardiaceae bacterium]
MFDHREGGVDERLRRVLRQRVLEYLAGVERMLEATEPPVSWAAVQERMRPLLAGWCALLAIHGAGRRGRCRHCDRIRWQRRAPCSVWRTAHAHLVTGVGGGAAP